MSDAGGVDGPAGSDVPTRRRETADESPLRTVGVATVLGVFGILVPLVIVSTLAGVVFLLEPPNLAVILGLLVVLNMVLFAAVGIGYLSWRGFDRRDIVRYMGVALPTPKQLLLILGAWVVAFIVTVGFALLVTTVLPELLGIEETEPAENPAAVFIAENPELIVLGVLFMLFVVGPCEEILFRGVIQNRLRERLSAVPAIVIASVIFAGAHVLALAGQDPVGIAMTLTILFVPGLALGAIYEYTGNIVIPSIFHGVHNSIILLAVYAAAVTEADAAAIVVWIGSRLLV